MMNKSEFESSKKQRQLIALACSHLGIGKVDKKVMLMTQFGVGSTTDLTFAQAEGVIDDLIARGFAIKSDKRPYTRRRVPVRAAHEKQSGKMVALASQAELGKIDALAGLIKWRVKDGMFKWMQKRLKIKAVRTAREAFVVIEGLKAMFEGQMKKRFGEEWWMQGHEDIEVCFYIAEHFPNLVGGNVVPGYARAREYWNQEAGLGGRAAATG